MVHKTQHAWQFYPQNVVKLGDEAVNLSQCSSLGFHTFYSITFSRPKLAPLLTFNLLQL